ncbi:hypothetical protein BKA61DRAFT_710161 [Leptodontidium sp. MPI-SDFR-AT-0119]|nr:hypothetical protein BKA61DRAFT_710161 [Leptodontidium sp. MPI-SDFR-AT-0119]
MSLTDILEQYRKEEGAEDITKAKWYIIAACAMAASSAGAQIPDLYRMASASLDLETEKVVQRRIKDAILKTSGLYGIPRSLQALLPLFAILPDDHIDRVSPRYDSYGDPEATKAREARGMKYFDTIWTPAIGEFNRAKLLKYSPDLFLLNLKFYYEWNLSEVAILSAVETQMCNAAALICSFCPTQATWHTRGIVRHGGTIKDARMAQGLGLAIAELYDARTGDIEKIEDIDLEDQTPP